MQITNEKNIFWKKNLTQKIYKNLEIIFISFIDFFS